MDKSIEILLGSEKNINSVNIDSYTKIELTRNTSEINEFIVNDVVNSSTVFDTERNENQVYRIYGRIEWMSLLNGLKGEYLILEDFFNPQYSGDSKNLINSFDFYLIAPHTGDTYNNISGTNNYIRNFQVIAAKEDIEIYNAGFSNNVYGEQTYAFSFKSDFDVSNYYDNLGFPLTELFLYAQYKPLISAGEQMSYTTWSTSTGIPSKSTLNLKDLNVGDDVENQAGGNINDIIEFIPEEYFQAQISGQTYYIRTKYESTKWLEWSYNPFIPVRLRYLDGVVSTAKLSEIIENTTTLDVELVTNPTVKINIRKPKKQTITTSGATITNWSATTSTYYSWNPTSGVLTFLGPGTYDITFKTSIYLPQGSDKYIGQTYIEENTTGSWIGITGTTETRRKYQITNTLEGTQVTGATYGLGDQIRIRVRLIPNPNIRKMFEIPDYALMLEADGKYVWRDILPQGYVDPIINLGVNYPFFNKRRYLFQAIVFDVPPNLSEKTWDKHQPTLTIFDEIEYYENATTLDLTPDNESNLDNIGKPCQ